MFDTIILFHVIAPFILTSSQKQLCKAELPLPSHGIFQHRLNFKLENNPAEVHNYRIKGLKHFRIKLQLKNMQ